MTSQASDPSVSPSIEYLQTRWHDIVHSALISSRWQDELRERLRASVVGMTDRRQLVQICRDLLSHGYKAISTDHDELEDGIKIIASKDELGNDVITFESECPAAELAPLEGDQTTLLHCFIERLTKKHKNYDLQGWVQRESCAALPLGKQFENDYAAWSFLMAAPQTATTSRELLEAIEQKVELLVQCGGLSSKLRQRTDRRTASDHITDEQCALLKRGADYLEEFGDLPAWIKEEKNGVLEAEITDVSESWIDSRDLQLEELGSGEGEA